MLARRWKLLIGLAVLVGIGGVGLVSREFYRKYLKPPPSLESDGGVVLVYELDLGALPDGKVPADYQSEEMVAILKRRLDPDERRGVTVRPLGTDRLEIGLPGITKDRFVEEQLAEIKKLVAMRGSLEFRILANDHDDTPALQAAQRAVGVNDPALLEGDRTALKADLVQRAEKGLLPPMPRTSLPWKTAESEGQTTYSWVELGPQQLVELRLDHRQKDSDLIAAVRAARDKGEAVVVPVWNTLLYSRPCVSVKLSPEERNEKEVDYFFLARDAAPGRAVDGRYLVKAFPSLSNDRPEIGFEFNNKGGDLFYDLTTRNRPDPIEAGHFRRCIAIILDGQVISAPNLMAPIKKHGVITGVFTERQVNDYVRILNAGSLPIPLKPRPVSESVVVPK